MKTAACIVAEARDFHMSYEHRFREGKDAWACAAMVYKADATKNKKGYCYQTLMCKSVYSFAGQVESLEVWPDVQPVVDKSGPGCLTLCKKQWLAAKFPVVSELRLCEGARAYRWCLAVTDGGSDQRYARSLLARQFEDKHYQLWGDVNCQQHVTSNGNKEQLLIADALAKLEWDLPFPYFSSFAQLAHTINYNQRKIRSHWEKCTRSSKTPSTKPSRVRCLNHVQQDGGRAMMQRRMRWNFLRPLLRR